MKDDICKSDEFSDGDIDDFITLNQALVLQRDGDDDHAIVRTNVPHLVDGQVIGEVMMRLSIVYAVVGRIVNFPLSLRLRAWAWVTQKRVFSGQKRGNITWGYVAWIG